MKGKSSDFIKILHEYNNDPYRKSYARTFYEATKCMLKEKELPLFYFTNLLYKKNIVNYSDYIGLRKSLQIKKEVFKANNILDDKILFQKFIEENNIPGPRFLALVEDGYLITNNPEKTTKSNLIPLLDKLISICTESNSIFIKPIDGVGGAGTYRISKENLTNAETINKLLKDLLQGKHIIQETVVQHSAMNRLGSTSLNTLRVISYKKPSGEIGIASALCRMGREGAHIDNTSLGGIFAPVDINNGKLEQFGYSFLASGGNSYTSHPDTGTIIQGFELPFFDQVLASVLHAASLFPNTVIGWDVAITANGPMFIEGNHRPHLTGAQIACGGFRKHPVYKEVFKKYL